VSKTMFLRFQLAEAKGEIPTGSAVGLTYATIAEAGAKSVANGFYGQEAVAEALSGVQKDNVGQTTAQREQTMMDLAEGVIRDIRPVTRALTEAHTTSDFPLALANLRTRILRKAYTGALSDWRSFASVLTVPDFKNIRGLRLSEIGGLKLRPEGTDVKFASFGESEDGYRVGNYERGLAYTWEMWENDEVGAFMRGLESLGRAAKRTEIEVVMQAIASGLTRITDVGQTGAPTIATIKAVRLAFAQRAFKDSDGTDVPYGFDITDIIFGTENRDAIQQLLVAETEPGASGNRGNTPNILRGFATPHFERLLSKYIGTDFVVFDNQVDWLEVAFKEGFQGGPKTYTKIPDVKEEPGEGSFANHTFEVKLGHVIGAKVIDPMGAARVGGA
jgi:hypothetical protein